MILISISSSIFLRRANYLVYPPLVVAYAVAGNVTVDLGTEPLGQSKDGNNVFLSELWPSRERVYRVTNKCGMNGR